MTHTLEKRFCECGCGMAFFCLPSSKAKFASVLHDPNASHPIDLFKIGRRHEEYGFEEDGKEEEPELEEPISDELEP